MFSHTFQHSDTFSHFSKSNIIVWLSLAFQAGAINTGGLLSCHRFVSHVTGFASLFGAEFAQGHFLTALGLLSVPVFFICGSMISAHFIDRKIQNNERPQYYIVMRIMSVLLLVVTVAGIYGGFGSFGDFQDLFDYYFLLASLCLASGLQNATVTSAFGAIVRTTHLTGITTDLGIGLMRVLSRSHKTQSRRNEVRANWMRVGIIGAFVSGSAVSAIVFFKWNYWGFMIPTAIASALFFWSYYRYHYQPTNNNNDSPRAGLT